VAAGAGAAIDDDRRRRGLGEQRVGEGESDGAGANDHVVSLQRGLSAHRGLFLLAASVYWRARDAAQCDSTAPYMAL
jgi:hypothetical protein